MITFKELLESVPNPKKGSQKTQEIDTSIAPVDPSEVADAASNKASSLTKKFNELSKAGKDKDADKMHNDIADAHEEAKNAHHAASIHHMTQSHMYEQQASITTDPKARASLMKQAYNHREKFIDHAEDRDSHAMYERHSRDDALGL